MRIIEEEKKPLFFEEEKLTPKESKYRSANKLLEAVDCVERFEHTIAALTSAQKLFEELEDYKDSGQKAQECARLAEKMHADGLEDAYQNAVKMQEVAGDKLEYRTVISEFERFSDYKDSAERIRDCKKKLRRIGTIQVWKNRGIAALVLLAAVGIFWVSPAKPYARGMVHMHQGRYRIAIQDFKACGNFIDSRWQKKKCRFRQAQKAYEKGDVDHALSLCLLARGRSDADEFMAELEMERIRGAKTGDDVQFGVEKAGRWVKLSGEIPAEDGSEGAPKGEYVPLHWLVLDNGDGKVTLLMKTAGVYRGIFDGESNSWSESHLRRWLNHKLKDRVFSDSEKHVIWPVVTDNPERPDKLYVLSREEYDKYNNTIRKAMEDIAGGDSEEAVADGKGQPRGSIWLRDAGGAEDAVCCVMAQTGEYAYDVRVTEEREILPVIQVVTDESLLEE